MSLKLTVLGPALVGVELHPRTAIDHRMKMLDLAPTLRKVLSSNGCSVEHGPDGQRYVRGLKCSVETCGADWHTLEDHPAMRYDNQHETYPGRPASVVCSVCGGGHETASRVFERLVHKGREAALDKIPVPKLPADDFTAVRIAGKIAIGGASFQETARENAPKRLDLDRDVEAVLVRAPSVDVAKAALEQEDFPADAWVNVPVTHELWPKSRWHDQRMTATDQAPIARHQAAERQAEQARIEAKVAAYRAELQAGAR